MRNYYIEKTLLLRQAIKKEGNLYTEFETNIIIAIKRMNDRIRRCSGNTLAAYLSKIGHTPGKQQLHAAIKKFKADGMLRIQGAGSATNIVLNQDAKLYLLDLEDRLKGMD